ncbi:hypothetical protein FLONG3_9590 [Fusarium longipes]|uniref:Uncharacterized protein n=1 Tax=Fusarium longipes TaxID=694270 RepID=A0A395RWA4_9HYPO|nr:hypothetical protein FLONG3_9590 [Fusarium longipes]
MKLQNETGVGRERPLTPETPETTTGTPGTPQSQDSSIPSVKDEMSRQEDGSRYLEDIVAEEVIYPLCRFFWRFILSPLWQWTVRPVFWECFLRPILWEKILRQGLWEGISRRFLWDCVLQGFIFEGIVQTLLGKRTFPPLILFCKEELIPLLEILLQTKVFPALKKLDRTILSPAAWILLVLSYPLRYLLRGVFEGLFGLLRPVLRRIPIEETLSFLFVVWISFRITTSSSDAYFFARGYRVETEEYSQRSDTEFGQIPYQEKYSWCWLLQWIVWILLGS